MLNHFHYRSNPTPLLSLSSSSQPPSQILPLPFHTSFQSIYISLKCISKVLLSIQAKICLFLNWLFCILSNNFLLSLPFTSITFIHFYLLNSRADPDNGYPQIRLHYSYDKHCNSLIFIIVAILFISENESSAADQIIR